MLINCVAYQNGHKIGAIQANQIHHYIVQPDAFVWVALRDADEKALELMQAEFDLHPLAVEDARHGHQRPKIEEYGESIFAVLHMIESTPEGERVGEVDIFVGANYILSVRSGVERGFQDVRTRCEREPELLRRGSGFVLYALMDAVVDRYFPALQVIETDLELIEEQIFSEISPRRNIEALYALKQRLTAFRHAVHPLLESLGYLTGARAPQLCVGMQEYFRDVSDHLHRLEQTIESLRDTVATATSVNIGMITLQENEVTKRLAAYAALVAVPTLIAGIYGMNFEHMPELHWRYGYGIAIGVMALLDGLLFYRFRKAHWL